MLSSRLLLAILFMKVLGLYAKGEWSHLIFRLAADHQIDQCLIHTCRWLVMGSC